MSRITELKKQADLHTDTSGRWANQAGVERFTVALLDDIVQYLSANATSFDGEVSHGINTAVRLVKERYDKDV